MELRVEKKQMMGRARQRLFVGRRYPAVWLLFPGKNGAHSIPVCIGGLQRRNRFVAGSRECFLTDIGMSSFGC